MFIRLLGTFVTVSLASCVTSPPPPAGIDLADARIGEEVRRLCFSSGISGFQKATPNSVILSRGTQDYLVTTRSRCHDLDQALSLALDSGTGCLSRGDKLFAYDSAFEPRTDFPTLPCYVDQIFVWDSEAVPDDTADPAEPAGASSP